MTTINLGMLKWLNVLKINRHKLVTMLIKEKSQMLLSVGAEKDLIKPKHSLTKSLSTVGREGR